MSTALATATLSDAEINAALAAAGLMEESTGGSGVNRVTLNGYMFTFDNGDVATSNPKTGAPAFRCRILDAPVEYQAAWLTEELATAIGRPGDGKRFCKSHFADPQQARKFSESGADCNRCPIGPFIPRDEIPEAADGRKCQWKGDISFQVLDADGTITDQTIHTLTLSTTGVIEFKGTAREKTKGSVSEHNFIQKLARYGLTAIEGNPQAGLAQALTALRLGGVIADVRALGASANGKNWTVPSFTPVQIIDVTGDELPALPEATSAHGDALPF